ncbi:uncharacterized protein BDZ99DRAFT_72741 [Mytilinidion resinicola]|uniref:Uncharacterized protein n=1 Tax=Mytilinidion resinicola TaxID=574789 RepID=A0A6A6YJJ1_9PEZI|nr:uncharacterized protein BDZ99DRAFT_72741 [Mytilinidion resinicola]KAF2808087.1 hypothetical protein BDZ99DRAFT_72741 [Mytilinidion resinicola]
MKSQHCATIRWPFGNHEVDAVQPTLLDHLSRHRHIPLLRTGFQTSLSSQSSSMLRTSLAMRQLSHSVLRLHQIAWFFPVRLHTFPTLESQLVQQHGLRMWAKDSRTQPNLKAGSAELLDEATSRFSSALIFKRIGVSTLLFSAIGISVALELIRDNHQVKQRGDGEQRGDVKAIEGPK